MKFKFYILKEQDFETVKHYVEPLEVELEDAKGHAQWGAKSGMISLVKPVRTTTTYWEL